MEKPSKFDRAVQEKLSGLEAEPSARVWSQVRAEIGGQPVHRPTPWLRIAAGAAILLMAGGTAFWMLRDQPIDPSGTPANSFAGNKTRVWPKAFIKRDTAQQAPSPEVLEYTAPGKRRHSQEPLLVKHDAPQQHTPVPAPSPQQQVQEQQIVQHPVQQEEVPQLIQQQEEKATAVAQVVGNEAQGQKRSFRMPGSQDFTIENLRSKSKTVLETIAEGAENKLGIPTDYQHTSTEAGDMTAFSVDLGFVKFRKVRSSK